MHSDCNRTGQLIPLEVLRTFKPAASLQFLEFPKQNPAALCRQSNNRHNAAVRFTRQTVTSTVEKTYFTRLMTYLRDLGWLTSKIWSSNSLACC